MNMEDQLIENHNVHTIEHEMKTNGYHLKEMKKKILVDSRYRLDKKTIIVHVRTIEDNQNGIRSYKVTEHFINGYITGNRNVDTDMTENEVNEFERDWKKYWHPKMKHGESETL